jgi:NAD(P)-dependent dehydrogenase (short-subunit alcohol dehydrogenase family)
MPFAPMPAYSTSKIAVKALCDSMRPLMSRYGVAVNVICPGYVESGMTEKLSVDSLPASVAAEFIRDGLERNIAVIAFPQHMYVLMTQLATFLPLPLRSLLVQYMWSSSVLPVSETGPYKLADDKQ